MYYETFKNVQFKLDPAHFYTSPGLFCQVLLSTATEYCAHEAKCKDWELCLDEFVIGLLKDIDMLLMFGKGVPGEITQLVKCYAEPIKKYMKDQYKTDQTSAYLQYLEINNVYGWEMIQKLPKFGFS